MPEGKTETEKERAETYKATEKERDNRNKHRKTERI